MRFFSRWGRRSQRPQSPRSRSRHPSSPTRPYAFVVSGGKASEQGKLTRSQFAEAAPALAPISEVRPSRAVPAAAPRGTRGFDVSPDGMSTPSAVFGSPLLSPITPSTFHSSSSGNNTQGSASLFFCLVVGQTLLFQTRPRKSCLSDWHRFSQYQPSSTGLREAWTLSSRPPTVRHSVSRCHEGVFASLSNLLILLQTPLTLIFLFHSH